MQDRIVGMSVRKLKCLFSAEAFSNEGMFFTGVTEYFHSIKILKKKIIEIYLLRCNSAI